MEYYVICVQLLYKTWVIYGKYISIARTSGKTDLYGISEGQSVFWGGLATETYFQWSKLTFKNQKRWRNCKLRVPNGTAPRTTWWAGRGAVQFFTEIFWWCFSNDILGDIGFIKAICTPSVCFWSNVQFLPYEQERSVPSLCWITRCNDRSARCHFVWSLFLERNSGSGLCLLFELKHPLITRILYTVIYSAILLVSEQIRIRLHVIHRAVYSMRWCSVGISGDFILDFIRWHHVGSGCHFVPSTRSHRLVATFERRHIVHFVFCGLFYDFLFAGSRCGWHRRLLFNLQYVVRIVIYAKYMKLRLSSFWWLRARNWRFISWPTALLFLNLFLAYWSLNDLNVMYFA